MISFYCGRELDGYLMHWVGGYVFDAVGARPGEVGGPGAGLALVPGMEHENVEQLMPRCRLMDLSKYQYELAKAAKLAKKKQRESMCATLGRLFPCHVLCMKIGY
jgi:hypothetical protein